MKYLQRRFSVPACSAEVSQEDWDRIFKPPPPPDTVSCPKGHYGEMIWKVSRTAFKASRETEYFCDKCPTYFDFEKGAK